MNINPNSIRVLCFGDSNTRGYVPGSLGKKRYPPDIRWTGVLQSRLGDDYEVIEEGLDARTTAFEDPRPDFPNRNGAQLLRIVLDSHKPLEWVILMLGTTDTKEFYNLSPKDITNGLEKNIKLIKSYNFGENSSSPKILIVTPPVVDEKTVFASHLFKGATEKGMELIMLYKNLSMEYSCSFLDASKILKIDETEGVHLSRESHQRLGELTAEVIKSNK
jgi:lysophospholipase L1-like esterase